MLVELFGSLLGALSEVDNTTPVDLLWDALQLPDTVPAVIDCYVRTIALSVGVCVCSLCVCWYVAQSTGTRESVTDAIASLAHEARKRTDFATRLRTSMDPCINRIESAFDDGMSCAFVYLSVCITFTLSFLLPVCVCSQRTVVRYCGPLPAVARPERCLRQRQRVCVGV